MKKHDEILGKALSRGTHATLAAVNIGGRWINQLGSVADLSVSGSNITGTYTSKVSSGGGSITGPIVGHVASDIVSLSVLWPTPAGSITSWVGQVVDEGDVEVLRTLWHLVVNIDDADEPTGLWTTIYSGADNFRR